MKFVESWRRRRRGCQQPRRTDFGLQLAWQPATTPRRACLLFERMLELVGTFFDVRQLWAPPTKRRLDAIAPISPDLHGLLIRIFCADDSTTEKLRLAHLALPLVFDPSS